MTAERGIRPMVERYPPGDQVPEAIVESSLGVVSGQPVEDQRVSAAVEALVRTTYPLASLRVRSEGTAHTRSLDVLRDESTRDEEMVDRARGGDRRALGELFERHHALAYRIALRLTENPTIAFRSVVSAFETMLADRETTSRPRIRLGIAARDAAIQAMPNRVPARAIMARTVVELAHIDALSATEIAAVLRLSKSGVAALAIEGLRSAAKTSA